ncbi:hypothetical protein GLOIN_2v1478829 [Rhizophagus clarus]|uniref:Uncharacterized protein n=1 Tax=Rhizophagus clarus TaxID=94130 RepID=A0A8H3QY54_9GLOM|nr:hypothetical protein GLOIN_2v1478829 [Rhizophagus clarus]
MFSSTLKDYKEDRPKKRNMQKTINDEPETNNKDFEIPDIEQNYPIEDSQNQVWLLLSGKSAKEAIRGPDYLYKSHPSCLGIIRIENLFNALLETDSLIEYKKCFHNVKFDIESRNDVRDRCSFVVCEKRIQYRVDISQYEQKQSNIRLTYGPSNFTISCKAVTSHAIYRGETLRTRSTNLGYGSTRLKSLSNVSHWDFSTLSQLAAKNGITRMQLKNLSIKRVLAPPMYGLFYESSPNLMCCGSYCIIYKIFGFQNKDESILIKYDFLHETTKIRE